MKMKKSVGCKTYLHPAPVVVVGTYDENNKPNIMTAAWSGIVNSNPPMISVSLRKATYTYKNIIAKNAFTINIPTREYIYEADYVGTVSGKNEDKFKSTGLTPAKSDCVDAPFVSEFPLVLECKLVKYDDLGLHTIFIGEVIDAKVDEEYLRDNGEPNIEKISPVSYMCGENAYYALGDFLGDGFSVWKNKESLGK
jgi:flavin reductase (DIM6/NTAB) family NADH-FMN oxidoreductase RutF